ncbi:DHA2 family efflux MFS transporter permease subunit [Streptomyces netropsis]|uniref:EmrB/QacA subfamily drug resistance transporter n=1 Tax=Streptomyces netropsis TaxID=55404 RepID=A0A7W7LCQ6_STRNE|nr:DHA2 family efflux MFS transporter permease subunit [Streptomyces netropsis]MBB4887263.1 EmrB/QacA subfamily drug resistance transporter [Streptomyces netropsis]GGR09052.1 MFS transporter [Streptomyces netropsis]
MSRLSPRIAVVIVYTAAMCMNGLDSTIVNPALLTIARDFGEPVSAANTVEIAFLVALAVALPVAGWLGDRYGTKRVFLGALAVFTAASAACGLAQNLQTLVLARVVQGLAGGLLTPVGMTLLFRAFPPHERMKLSKVLIVPTALMPALGPPLGGFLTEHLSWHWLFFVNVPIGAAAVLLGVLGVREHVEGTEGGFDRRGFLLATPALGLLTYALGFGPSHGWTSPAIAVSALLGLALLVAACAHLLRAATPLLDLGLLGDKVFGSATVLALVTSAGLMGVLFAFPLLYQAALGASALDAGLSVFPEALGLMLASQAVDRLLPKLGPRLLAAPALVLATAVFAALAVPGVAENAWAVRALMFCVGLVLGTAVLTVQIAGFADIAPPVMGQAMGLFTIVRTLGGALGIAATAAVIGASGGSGTHDAAPGPYRAAILTTAGLVALGTLFALRLPKDAPAPPPFDDEPPARSEEGAPAAA